MSGRGGGVASETPQGGPCAKKSLIRDEGSSSLEGDEMLQVHPKRGGRNHVHRFCAQGIQQWCVLSDEGASRKKILSKKKRRGGRGGRGGGGGGGGGGDVLTEKKDSLNNKRIC